MMDDEKLKKDFVERLSQYPPMPTDIPFQPYSFQLELMRQMQQAREVGGTLRVFIRKGRYP